MPAAEPAHPAVLHLVTDPRRRGAQNLARDLHAELLRRGHRSELRSLRPHPDAPGTEDARPLGPTRYHPATLRALRAAARRADVVVAHGSSTLPACAAALLGSRTPFVYVNIGDPRHWTASPARRLRTGLLLRRAAAVAAISDGAREVLLDHYRLPARTVRTIPNGRSADRYPPAADEADRQAARAALGLPADGPLLAWVGALAAEKRPDLAIDALALLPGVHLALAGDGPLRAATAARDTTARARFLGTLADPAPLYRAADALLLTSDSEGVPGVLVEAALAGLPAVATDVGWVRDIVLDGITGTLVPPGDATALAGAVDRLLADAHGALGAAARRHALDRFDLAVVTDAWQQLLAETARIRPRN
ncbi:glycosyltransferase involved in cell wall bisynthesis [Streptomyces sp. TLI_235]|nr:glycosyltransferase family 4 protein [Streptomyces sp. TLI_235]PBC71375.1 glycosyltransferase involved in cell wall bisynthesis [Streptomyces sp. TLI_235]